MTCSILAAQTSAPSVVAEETATITPKLAAQTSAPSVVAEEAATITPKLAAQTSAPSVVALKTAEYIEENGAAENGV